MKPLLRIGILSSILLQFALLSGCAQLLGSLRRGVEDEPQEQATVGGRWHERGFFNDDRAPASMPSEGDGAGDSWVSSDQNSAAQRNTLRGTELYSQNPNMMPSGSHAYKNGFRATRADFVDDHPSEGSLWSSSGQTNYYLTKNKIRSVGDILSINIEEGLMKDIAAEVRRGLDPAERDAELAVAQEKLYAKAHGIGEDGKPLAGAAARAPAAVDPKNPNAKAEEAEEVAVPKATPADINVGAALDIKPGEPMMAEIVERYPNGNYKIRGIKRIPYKNGAPRLISLVGIAKSSDVSEEDVLNSGKIYEYRIEAHR